MKWFALVLVLGALVLTGFERLFYGEGDPVRTAILLAATFGFGGLIWLLMWAAAFRQIKHLPKIVDWKGVVVWEQDEDTYKVFEVPFEPDEVGADHPDVRASLDPPRMVTIVRSPNVTGQIIVHWWARKKCC